MQDKYVQEKYVQEKYMHKKHVQEEYMREKYWCKCIIRRDVYLGLEAPPAEQLEENRGFCQDGGQAE